MALSFLWHSCPVTVLDIIVLMCRNCEHIIACGKLLKPIRDDPGISNLPDIPEPSTVEQPVTVITTSNSESCPFPRTVSHVAIQPPTWCRLPGDKERPTVLFKQGENLPPLLTLEEASRCSCGYSGTYDEQNITETPFIIYASSRAFVRKIQTVYCEECRYTKGRIGPDLGNYSVFNYNNQWGFSHELLNDYTSRLVCHGETTFRAVHQTIRHAYSESASEIKFCELKIFENAWFAFVRLQELDTNMQCSICGPHPATIIADGVAVSFSKDRIHSLVPPTRASSDKVHIKFPKLATKTTSFPGPVNLQKQIYNALRNHDRITGMREVRTVLEESPMVIPLIS